MGTPGLARTSHDRDRWRRLLDDRGRLGLARTPPGPSPTVPAEVPPASPLSRGIGGSPGARPTLDTSLSARRVTQNDPRMLQLRARIDRSCRAEGPPQPPTEPRPTIAEATAEANDTGDLSGLDRVDHFREGLSPADRKVYDRRLQDLRDDERVRFQYRDGEQPDPAMEDLMRRGLIAASFGNPEQLENAIRTAGNHELVKPVDESGDAVIEERDGDGTFDIYVYPDGDDLGYSGGAPASGDLVVGKREFFDTLEQGDNLIIHEFGHVAQGASLDGGEHDKTFTPHDFPFEDELRDHLDDQGFEDYLTSRGLNAEGLEAYPTVLNLFLQSPEGLRGASPEIYDLMRRYTGFDPAGGGLTGEPERSDPISAGDVIRGVIDFIF